MLFQNWQYRPPTVSIWRHVSRNATARWWMRSIKKAPLWDFLGFNYRTRDTKKDVISAWQGRRSICRFSIFEDGPLSDPVKQSFSQDFKENIGSFWKAWHALYLLYFFGVSFIFYAIEDFIKINLSTSQVWNSSFFFILSWLSFPHCFGNRAWM